MLLLDLRLNAITTGDGIVVIVRTALLLCRGMLWTKDLVAGSSRAAAAADVCRDGNAIGVRGELDPREGAER